MSWKKSWPPTSDPVKKMNSGMGLKVMIPGARRQEANSSDMRYRSYAEKHMILRDHLAHDRTVMALERTLLSYIRTAFFLVTTGITVIKLLGADLFFLLAGIFLCAAAAGAFAFGVGRYLRFRRKLELVYKSGR